MNPALIVSFFFGGDLKKYIAITLATLAVVIALPVLAVFSMGSDVLAFLSGSPSAISAEEQGFYLGPSTPGNGYVWGNCTYWVYSMRYWANSPIGGYWGNANMWDESAAREGYLIDRTPTVGAIMQTDEGDAGHVAYVTDVNSETGQWKISEMNAPHLNVVSTRTFDKSAAAFYKFIHGKIQVTP